MIRLYLLVEGQTGQSFADTVQVDAVFRCPPAGTDTDKAEADRR